MPNVTEHTPGFLPKGVVDVPTESQPNVEVVASNMVASLISMHWLELAAKILNKLCKHIIFLTLSVIIEDIGLSDCISSILKCFALFVLKSLIKSHQEVDGSETERTVNVQKAKKKIVLFFNITHVYMYDILSNQIHNHLGNSPRYPALCVGQFDEVPHNSSRWFLKDSYTYLTILIVLQNEKEDFFFSISFRSQND